MKTLILATFILGLTFGGLVGYVCSHRYSVVSQNQIGVAIRVDQLTGKTWFFDWRNSTYQWHPIYCYDYTPTVVK